VRTSIFYVVTLHHYHHLPTVLYTCSSLIVVHRKVCPSRGIYSLSSHTRLLSELVCIVSNLEAEVAKCTQASLLKQFVNGGNPFCRPLWPSELRLSTVKVPKRYCIATLFYLLFILLPVTINIYIFLIVLQLLALSHY
jgi:hypothetical protein